jgi:mRNA interferase MazF
MSIEQGEIWEVEFFPNVGSEIGKKRPAVVVSHDLIGRLPLKTIVPITEWSNSFSNYPWMLKLQSSEDNGLKKDSSIDCFQIRNFSIHRFVKKIGNIDEATLKQVHSTILKTLNPKYKL